MEQAFRAEATVSEDGSVNLRGLPFRADERVEVIVLTRDGPVHEENVPLRATVVRYDDPTGSVVEDDCQLAS